MTTPSTKPVLDVIVASTRPGRVGLPVANWFNQFAQAHGKYEVRFIDLARVNLPILDEPLHPAMQKYEHQHTKDWSATVNAADAYAIVTPEYNYGPPPALINALNYVYREWNYKPVGFVSYGGISGGLRSVQMLKQVVTTLKLVPMMEGVAIPFVNEHLKDGKTFEAKEFHQKTATQMLDELLKWTVALKTMRA